MMSCYFPNGKVASDHTPCNTSADDSHCCASADACLTNNYCLSASGNFTNTLVRGSCTDSTWRANACPLQCFDVSAETIVILNMASATNGAGAGTWCCNDVFQVNNTCQDATHGETAPWALANGRLIYDRANGSIVPVNSTSQTSLAGSTASLATPSNSTTTCPTPTLAPQSPNTSREAAIGAGIGAPLALVIFVLAFLYWRATHSAQQLRLRLAAMEQMHSISSVSKAYREKMPQHQLTPWELGPDASQNRLLGGTPVAELDVNRRNWR